MKTVRIKRLSTIRARTFGILTVDNLKLFTVELPWNDNKNNISCIPPGEYRCSWTLSPRLKRFTYEVTSVKGRSGIRIHSGNFPKQFLGCIGLGMTTGVMDEQQGVFQSQTAIRKFESHMQQQSFNLEIA